jgi:MFS family permease
MSTQQAEQGRWYEGVTAYQWWVLALASLGWVFDVFEGQIFVASMNEAMPALLPQDTPKGVQSYYNGIALAAFLLGGALGGVLFGMLADRFGRKRVMGYTILVYSAFTCLSAFSQEWWQLAAFRFLVALGVGGEWAVASALVAEVFPGRARAWSQSIFHASSVLGTFLAVAAGIYVVGNTELEWSVKLLGREYELSGWRLGFLLGALPALLIIAVRWGLREPERWVQSRQAGAGRVPALFAPGLRTRTLIGVGLATVGLATFWGTHIYGKDALRAAHRRELLEKLGADADEKTRDTYLRALQPELKRSEMLGMFLTTVGGGLGLLCFGALAEWLGRRGAFLLYQVGGLVSTLVLFRALTAQAGVQAFLPFFGFLTLGMHAGFAVYFPELYPTHLRSTGAGFCFNAGRVLAAPILFLGGWLQRTGHFSLAGTASLWALLFVPGLLLLIPAPETRGQELP